MLRGSSDPWIVVVPLSFKFSLWRTLRTLWKETQYFGFEDML